MMIRGGNNMQLESINFTNTISTT